MRKGNEAAVIFDEDGEILLIATGSDYCAEHEQGSLEMQKFFCRPLSPIYSPMTGKETSMEGLLNELRHNQKFFDGYFKGEIQYDFPKLLERKQLRQNLEHIHFDLEKDEEGDDIAILCANGNRAHARQELRYFGKNFEFDAKTKKRIARPAEFCGAWGSKSFAFAVKGEELIAKFARFFQKIKESKAIFAGSFVSDSGEKRLAGVIVMDSTRLKPEHLKSIETAQVEYEHTLLLNAHEASQLVNQASIQGKAKGHGLGYSHVWNVWHPDETASYSADFVAQCVANKRAPEVAVAINPDSDIAKEIAYLGPYRTQDLVDFALGKTKKIERLRKTQEVEA